MSEFDVCDWSDQTFEVVLTRSGMHPYDSIYWNSVNSIDISTNGRHSTPLGP